MKSASPLSTKGIRRDLLPCLFGVLGLLVARNSGAAEYYVSTTGSDSNTGTIDQPFATLQKGVNTAAVGDTVWIRGGTYSITTPATSAAGINFTKSGTSDTARIKYWAYPGELPVFDFSNMAISTSGYTMGFSVSGSWLHFKGLEIRGVPMNTFSNNGVAVTSGGNDIFELLNMHHNSGNGIFIGSKSAGGHLVLNCDAHDNYDATSSQGQGQNADGFGVHYQTAGATTIVRGCRAWWNSDDGYDLINQEIPVTVENSWAMGNGYADYGATNPSSGNGNGFKMGSSRTGVRHLVQNNVAWKNKASGFYANHSTGGNTWYNNTSFQNGTNYNMLASSFDSSGNVTGTIVLTGALAHIMRNNLGYPTKNANMDGVDTQFNTWDLNITPAAKDFLTISDPSVSGTGQAIETTSPMFGPRQADGSLPNVDFLKLAAGSAMIDKGTDVGLPFNGATPDLGAYEYGATTGAGGAAGTGAATGAGGAVGSGGGVGSGGASGRDAGPAGTGGSRDASPGGNAGVTGSGGTTVAGSGGTSAAGSGGTVAGSGGAAAGGSGGINSTVVGAGGSGSGGQSGTTTGKTTKAGCSCTLGAEAAHVPAGAWLAMLGFLWSVVGLAKGVRLPSLLTIPARRDLAGAGDALGTCQAVAAGIASVTVQGERRALSLGRDAEQINGIAGRRAGGHAAGGTQGRGQTIAWGQATDLSRAGRADLRGSLGTERAALAKTHGSVAEVEVPARAVLTNRDGQGAGLGRRAERADQARRGGVVASTANGGGCDADAARAAHETGLAFVVAVRRAGGAGSALGRAEATQHTLVAAEAARALGVVAAGGAVGKGAVEGARRHVVGEDVVAGGGGKGRLTVQDACLGHAAAVRLGLRRTGLGHPIGAASNVTVHSLEVERRALVELGAQRGGVVARLHGGLGVGGGRRDSRIVCAARRGARPLGVWRRG